MANILPVPESEKRVLENLLRDLNNTYPDKIIRNLGRDHGKWSEKVTRLYKNIGYASRDEFFAAYGYTEEKTKGGRPSGDLNAIVEELISRYEGDRFVTSVDQLKEENPDLAPKFKNIQNKAKELFGMSFNNYLKEKGVFQSNAAAEADRAATFKLKLDAVVEELKKRYEGKELPDSLATIKDDNSDIAEIGSINAWTEKAYGKKGLEYFKEQGLIKEKEKKPEKTEEEKKAAEFKKLASDEKLAAVTEELKRRVAEDNERVLATNLKDTVEALKKRYPDLPVQTIDAWIKKAYPGKGTKMYLIEQGIVQTVREECIARIEHIDDIDLSKKKIYMEEEDSRILSYLQIMGKAKAVLSDAWSWDAKGGYYVIDTDDRNPMKGENWDNYYILKYGYKFISKANLLEVLEKKVLKKGGKASKGKAGKIKAGSNPIESFCLEAFIPELHEMFLKKQKISDKYFKSVKYKDAEETAPAFVVECAVVPYMEKLKEIPKQIGSYERDASFFEIDPNADKVAAALDPESFSEMLDNLIGPDMPAVYHTLVPYGRYATGKQITGLISRMNRWKRWDDYSASGRKSIIIARGAITLNESREAMLYADKVGCLNQYARIRNLDIDVLRDNNMSDFGLDENGQKTFDLGNTTIEVSVSKELKLSLYDTQACKEVKSIPKRGADPDKYEKAKAEFADIKKNLKEIVKNRTNLLFSSFLNSTTRKPESWKSSYLNNYLLHKVGELIVWNQKGKTFTLTQSGIVDCFGADYEINDKDPINVAHPIQMTTGEIKAWQRYFTSNGLKQPFEQIWEPVINKDNLKPNRYEGRMIPYYKFLKQEKHGIFVRDYNYHNDIDIRFADCEARVDRVDWTRHQIDMNHRFEVKSISVRRMTRQANHILAWLDKVTMIDRVMADDVTIADMLDSFSYAQIEDYIKLANDNNCNNVLAILMNYKNEQFADFDPMDEFVLD